MPAAIPIAAAAFGVGSGIAALGAATTIGGTLLAGATIVGSALTGIGALTGNQRLTKVGALVGAVGGIGTALTRATAAGAAADAAKATAANNVADAIAAKSPAAQALTEGASSAAAPGLLEAAGGSPLSSALEQANPFLTGGESLAAPSLSSALADGGILGNSALTATPAAAAPSGILDRVAGFGQGVSDFIKSNPEAAKLYGGVIQGAMKPYLERQALKDRMAVEKKYEEWARQKYSDSVRNLVIPSPVPFAPGIIQGQRG
jgi:hypothetical protein